MARYYAARGWVWDANLITSSWLVTQNLVLTMGDAAIGVLRTSLDPDALVIRDIQVVPEQQGQGAGSYAVKLAAHSAVENGREKLRLRVFRENPAKALYERLGFRQVAVDSELGVFTYERSAA